MDTGELEDSPLNRGVMKSSRRRKMTELGPMIIRKGQLRQDVRKSFPGRREQQAHRSRSRKEFGELRYQAEANRVTE